MLNESNIKLLLLASPRCVLLFSYNKSIISYFTRLLLVLDGDVLAGGLEV